MLFSVGVNVNQYGCFLSLNAIRELFDNINEAMQCFQTFFILLVTGLFRMPCQIKQAFVKQKGKLFCFSEQFHSS